MECGLKVKIWGTRGSLAAPFADRMRFGGNTSCVSACWKHGIAVFDCGTGLHALGQELLRRNDICELHLFIGHLHLDHVCALPFFPLLFRKEWRIHIYGQPIKDETFEETIRRIVGPPFWPITMEQAAAQIIWHDILPDMVIELAGNVQVKTAKANHGPGALIYRVEYGETSFVYGADHEVTEETKDAYYEFIKNCDVLLFDGMYTDEEYVRCKGFGHSTWKRGLEVASMCGVGTVCITHHDWSRTDEVLENMECEAKEIFDRCVFAREGMEFRLFRREWK